MTRRQFLALLLPLLFVITAFIVLWGLERGGVSGAPTWDSEFAQYVRDRMGQEYVRGTGDKRRQWEAYFRALDAYVKTWDAYAEITPPWEAEEERVRSSGRYTGIGVRIESPQDATGAVQSVLVSGVKPGGPADVAGVAVGDRILAVDGKPIPEILPDARAAARLAETPLQTAIKGLEGTTVVLRLLGPDGKERDAPVVRGAVDQGSVFGARFLDRERGIGYVRIAVFQASTAKDLRARLDELSKEGMKALVLDLRGNHGGLLDQAIGVANLFLESGVIAQRRGRLKEFDATYRADPKETWNARVPLALLVNGSSASASEVLAGALRDHRRAVLVGERTWGKFLVQLLEDRPMDAGIAIFKRTTSVYESPLGFSYQRAGDDDPLAGIPPDLFVPMAEGDRPKLQRVFEDESFADWNPGRAPTALAFADVQIDAALSLLKGEAVCPPLP